MKLPAELRQEIRSFLHHGKPNRWRVKKRKEKKRKEQGEQGELL
jgi:hypothetical protein